MMRALAVLLAVAVAAGAGYFYGRRQSHDAPPAAAAPGAERKVLYWHDPMVPQQKFDKPGKSPFMDMDLVPVYADGQASGGEVTISPGTRQNLGVRTAPVTMAEFRQEFAAVGAIQADERRMARAEARTPGWIERLHVRATNEPVAAGQVLAELYSPEVVAAQEEYLLARKMADAAPSDRVLAVAALRRLETLGVPPEAVARLEREGTASRRVPILAPISGVVSELAVREGAMVAAGTPVFTITDLSSVWVAIDVPESRSTVLRPGQGVRARIQSLPDREFGGTVDYVYPDLNAQTRSVRARAVLPNPRLELKPGMYVDVTLALSARKALSVPSEAVIQTGTRSVVIVADGDRFRAATVKTGVESGGHSEILDGLKAGERVVASGQFLIDSEANLKGVLDRMKP
jgi:Cu(I)/Ag(I) efflux system membrane fusion protein